jgi:CheY-like chemotaxis protein
MTIRPVFRVAVAGLDDRDVRLIEIVFKHSLYNRYDFQLLDQADPLRTDILIVNPAVPAGLDALAALRAHSREIPAISALPRGAQAAARHAITIDRLTLQLLPTLNRVVELEGLQARSARQGGGAEGSDPALAATAAAGSIDERVDCSIPMVADRIDIEAGSVVSERSDIEAGSTIADRIEIEAGSTIADRIEIDAGSMIANRTGIDGVHSIPSAAADRSGPSPSLHVAELADALVLDAPFAAAVEPAPVAAPSVSADLGRVEAPAFEPARVDADVCPVQVLVVDPSLAAQQQLTRALRSRSLQVQCVISAAAALQCVAHRQYDLVITEYGLSDVSGFHLIAALRQRAGYRTTPILLLRSRIGLFDGARARLHGDVMLLTKPLTRVELQVVVADVLRRSVALDELQTLFDEPRR